MELSFEFSTVKVISYKRLPLWIYPLDTSNDLRHNADPLCHLPFPRHQQT